MLSTNAAVAASLDRAFGNARVGHATEFRRPSPAFRPANRGLFRAPHESKCLRVPPRCRPAKVGPTAFRECVSRACRPLEHAAWSSASPLSTVPTGDASIVAVPCLSEATEDASQFGLASVRSRPRIGEPRRGAGPRLNLGVSLPSLNRSAAAVRSESWVPSPGFRTLRPECTTQW